MADRPEITLETITPGRAREMLELNTRNRRIKPEDVEYLAGCIERGEWVVNGETLKFLDSGQLGDGQHRLGAVMLSGVTIETLVVRGLSEKAFDSVDTQKARRLSEVLMIEGYERTVFLAAALNQLHRYTGDDFTFGKAAAASTGQALALLQESPGLERSTMLAGRVHRAVGYGPAGVLAMLHYLFSQVDPEAADEFFERLVDGVMLSGTDPVLHLRNRFINEHRKPRRDRIKAPEAAHLTIVAFNHRRAGTEMEKLRARFSDPFPAILPKGVVERQRNGDHFRHHGAKRGEVVTTWDQVRAIVDSAGRPMGPEEVAALVHPPAPVPTVNACLWRDARNGRLKKAGRGLYAARDHGAEISRPR